jgi:hypothetical protein
VTNAIAFYGGSITNVVPGYGSVLYRMDVPAEATRIQFNASNSANVVLSLEQGTMALAGGPAHWTSYNPPSSQVNNRGCRVIPITLPLPTPPPRPRISIW